MAPAAQVKLTRAGDAWLVRALGPAAINDPLRKFVLRIGKDENGVLVVRGEGQPEMSGERATASLAVIRAGIVSAKEGRRVTVVEVLA